MGGIRESERPKNAKMSDEQRRRASYMWKKGFFATEIGKELGVSRNTIVGIAFRDRQSFPEKGKGRGYARTSQYGPVIEWTEELIAKASALWKGGATISVIADAIGSSVDAVSGIARRNRDRFPNRKRYSLVGKARQQRADNSNELHDGPVVSRTEFDASRMALAKPLMELGDCECKWALTDRGPHLFCAEVTAPGKSWCSHHASRIFGEGTKSERNAIRDANYAGKAAA